MIRNLKALTADLTLELGSSVAQTPTARPDRIDKKLIAAHFDRDTARTLKTMAAEQDTTVEGLLARALVMLFRTEKKPISDYLAQRGGQ